MEGPWNVFGVLHTHTRNSLNVSGILTLLFLFAKTLKMCAKKLTAVQYECFWDFFSRSDHFGTYYISQQLTFPCEAHFSAFLCRIAHQVACRRLVGGLSAKLAILRQNVWLPRRLALPQPCRFLRQLPVFVFSYYCY